MLTTNRHLTLNEDVRALRDIANGGLKFRDCLVVSNQSSYGDDIWCWVDPDNKRLEGYSPNRLTINWINIKLKYDLTDDIVTDLKRLAFIRHTHSRAVFIGNRLNGNAHPATVANEIKTIALFLSHLRAQMSSQGYSLISKLSDIEIEDISDALSTYVNTPQPIIKKVLMYLSSPALSDLLYGGPLKWNENDIKSLPWNFKKREPHERVPDALFRFLSDVATADVKQFLLALSIPPKDTTKIGEGSNLFTSVLPNFRKLYEEYVRELPKYRRKRRYECKEEKDYRKAVSMYTMWCNKMDSKVADLSKLIDRARIAAQLIIAMYTGARLSELNSFEQGCVRQRADGWVLVGTVIKKEGLHSPVNRDEWVAIPIVRDAVTLLEETAVLTESRKLFRSTKVRTKSTYSVACSGVVAEWFNKYLGLTDTKNRWENHRLHVHKFRHTLVFQMRRAGLNLPFITYQLKHTYDALNSKLNNVTLSYGNITGDSTHKAIQDANLEFVRQLYHPDAPVAGGGAEEFKVRRAAFFQGLAVQGFHADDLLKKLARQGMPLTDVGLGLCQGQKKIVKDGIKEDPPCIGQLRCNPVRCANGLIPKYKVQAWERVACESSSRALDAEFAHARTYHEEVASEAEAVLRFFKSSETIPKSGD